MDWKIGKPVRLMVASPRARWGSAGCSRRRTCSSCRAALPTNLVRTADIGLTFHGDPFDGLLSYAAGSTTASRTAAAPDVDTNNGKEGAARPLRVPFSTRRSARLRDSGRHRRNLWPESAHRRVPASRPNKSARSLRPSSPGSTTALRRPRDGGRHDRGGRRRSRVAPSVLVRGAVRGEFAEYVRSTQDVERGAISATLTSRGLERDRVVPADGRTKPRTRA